MKLRIAIADPGGNYGRRLAESLNTAYFDRTETSLFTGESALSLPAGLHADVTLVPEGYPGDMASLPGRVCVIDGSGAGTPEGLPSVSRFAGTGELVARLFEMCAGGGAGTAPEPGGGERPKLAVFMSPCGGAGNSTLAEAYAASSCYAGRPAVLLSFDRSGYPEGSGRGMSDLIFALRTGRGDLASRAGICTGKTQGGTAAVRPPEGPFDVSELRREDMAAIVKAVSASGPYGLVVADVPFGFEPWKLGLADLADRLFAVSAGGPDRMEKTLSGTGALMKASDGAGSLCIVRNLVRPGDVLSPRAGALHPAGDVLHPPTDALHPAGEIPHPAAGGARGFAVPLIEGMSRAGVTREIARSFIPPEELL